MTALARTRTATTMAFRDQLRRPLVLILIVVIPAYIITRSIAETLATPRRIGLPDGVFVTTTIGTSTAPGWSASSWRSSPRCLACS